MYRAEATRLVYIVHSTFSSIHCRLYIVHSPVNIVSFNEFCASSHRYADLTFANLIKTEILVTSVSDMECVDKVLSEKEEENQKLNNEV